MNSLRRNLIITLVSILLLLGGLEGYARIFLNVQPTVERFQLSHQLGWEWTPGYDAIETYHGVDYKMVISRQGLRNEEIRIPKPANTYRIIALGDSITEGPGVVLENTFVKLLEQSLQAENLDRSIEVINAGTGDYGTEQEFIWLRERGLTYEPDAVILGVYLNDSRSFTPPPALIATLNNFFVQRSGFYTFYRNIFRQRLVSKAEAAPDFRFRFVDTWQSQAWRNDPEALVQTIQAADQDWGLAWHDREMERLKAGLTDIIRLTDEHNIGLLLVIFPVDVQVYAQVDTPLGLDWPQQQLITFAQDQDVLVLDLLPLLRAQDTDDLFYDQAHLKPEAHRLVADILLQILNDHKLLSRP